MTEQELTTITSAIYACSDRAILRQLNQMICDQLKTLDRRALCTFKIGDRVTWYSPKQGYKMNGTVTKIGRRRLTVNTQVGEWTLPAGMAQKA